MSDDQAVLDFDAPPALLADPDWLARPRSVIEWDFRRYHDANPGVYLRLEEAALAWATSSPKRVGVKRLAENLRYAAGLTIAKEPHAAFKINNNHTALYARLLIHRHPHLEAVIELRVRKEPDASI